MSIIQSHYFCLLVVLVMLKNVVKTKVFFLFRFVGMIAFHIVNNFSLFLAPKCGGYTEKNLKHKIEEKIYKRTKEPEQI